MFIYAAEPEEVEALRAVFGPTVAEVTFWDADFPEEAIEATGSRWALTEAWGSDGESLGRATPDTAGWEHLEELLADRDETVKFGLRVID